MKNEIKNIKYDLNLIKSRGAFKSFIDFFYLNYELKGAKNYEEKATKVSEKLNNFNNIQKNDIESVYMVKSLLRNAATKLNQGNFKAHIIDKNKPVLSLLFKIIDPDGDYNKVEEKLNSINADTKIFAMIKNRENNYLDKDELIRDQEKILKPYDANKLNTIFTK